MIDEYKALAIKPTDVFPQSFHHADIMYWIQHEPAFASQAVFLDAAEKPQDLPDLEKLKQYKKQGVRIVAPPIFALLDVKDDHMVPSRYAKDAKQAGLDIISWSLERSGVMAIEKGGWYYQTVNSVVQNEGDIYEALHVLTQDVGIMGLFSDWPATTTYYANCMQINRAPRK
jgi:glycerophosphoryl diester phosphodiesterase